MMRENKPYVKINVDTAATGSRVRRTSNVSLNSWINLHYACATLCSIARQRYGIVVLLKRNSESRLTSENTSAHLTAAVAGFSRRGKVRSPIGQFCRVRRSVTTGGPHRRGARKKSVGSSKNARIAMMFVRNWAKLPCATLRRKSGECEFPGRFRSESVGCAVGDILTVAEYSDATWRLRRSRWGQELSCTIWWVSRREPAIAGAGHDNWREYSSHLFGTRTRVRRCGVPQGPVCPDDLYGFGDLRPTIGNDLRGRCSA